MERYLVVVNDEEQYSLWPEGRPLPAGWRAEGFAGEREACLAHIETVWTDLRPAICAGPWRRASWPAVRRRTQARSAPPLARVGAVAAPFRRAAPAGRRPPRAPPAPQPPPPDE